MAVVQISRIQVRRGKINSGTGLPQLASGEMAWAIDTQELYIGNGAVSEGAPAVGNTKILTANDLTSQGNILNIVTYIYKPNDITIVTGPDANNPTTRILQDRLDDLVSVYAFGAVGDGVTDDTVSIQRAIDQLFLNNATKASDDTPEGVATRKILSFPSGIFKITDTIYIPSYANIQGSGLDKSIILFEPDSSIPNNPAFKFINDTSTIGDPATISSTDSDNQPRSISMSGFTLNVTTGENTCLYMDCVRDSFFENIKLIGGWTASGSPTSAGIVMNAKSSLVTCQNNLFKNIKFESLFYAMFAKGDIRANQFKDCYVGGLNSACYQGFMLGLAANGYSIGEQYGPRETQIIGTQFNNVKRHAVYVDLGTKNTTKGNTYTNVGCNGSGNTQAAYPQVYFNTVGNTSFEDVSDRPDDLATANPLSVYVPEVAGHGIYKPNFSNQVNLGYQIIPVPAFRLPIATDQNSAPNGTIVYTIEYFYKSVTHPFSRKGTITISADIDRAKIQLSDDYIISADPNLVSETNQLRLDFSAKLVDTNSNPYTSALGQTVAGIVVYYFNDYSADGGLMNYTYSASF